MAVPVGKRWFKSLEGTRSGMLTATGEYREEDVKRRFWLCKCDCGGERWCRGDTFQSGRIKSCGCDALRAQSAASAEAAEKRRLQRDDLTGREFGRLTVTRNIRGDLWACRCKCGVETTAWGKDFRTVHKSSCGCLQRDKAKEQATVMGSANLRHGASGSPEWVAWHHLWQRVTNENCPAFDDYGGRGISVCERWREFENFLADMGLKPSPEHSIDRIDVNGHYEPGNCRWATHKEQQRNRRNNRLIEHNGVTRCLSEWAESAGLPTLVLYNRLKKGWPFEKAIGTPLIPRGKRHLSHRAVVNS